MKKIRNAVLIISLAANVIAIILGSILYQKIDLIESSASNNPVDLERISISRNDNLTSILFGKLDSNFNLILTTITVLFVLFGLLTYIGVKLEFASELKKIKRKYLENQERFEEQKNELDELRGDLSFEVALNHESRIHNILNKKERSEEDIDSLIVLYLLFCDNCAQCLIHKNKPNWEFKTSVLTLIKENLKDLVKLLPNDSHIMTRVTIKSVKFFDIQKNISKVGDLDDKQNLAYILSKLKFPLDN